MTGWLIAAFVATTLVAPVGAESTKVSIFVGPQTRDGFVDVDTGVLDSIKDIRDELRSSKRFVLVPTEAAATIVLTVVGRRTAGQSGSVGVPIAGMLMMLPIKRRAIDTVLRVGSYEKAITSEDDNNDQWKASAKQAVRDVIAWVEANRAVLAQVK